MGRHAKAATLLLVLFTLICCSKCDDGSESEDLRKREPGFVFTYPKTLLAGKNETVCLALFDAVLPTKILLDLKIKDKHYLSAHTTETEYSCFNLRVPEQHKAREPIGTSLHLQLQLNGTVHSAHNQETVLMYPRKDVTFIETDRGYYKPGEKVRMRVLVLKHDLRPPLNHTQALTVKVLNPGGITVAVWKNVQTEMGLAQLDFQLAEDTVMGKWKVEANDASRHFNVKRYVLPRFKVTVLHPKVVYKGAENVTFSVCAEYAYGKAVRGIALIKISYPDMLLDAINKIKKMEDGCSRFTFTNVELHLDNSALNYRSIHIVGTVTEDGTNKIEIDSGKTRVTGSPYSIEFSSSDRPYFQPGLPYRGALKITDAHVPIEPGVERAEICFNIAVKKAWNIKQQYCKNLTFDAHTAEIQFSLLPPKDNVVLINLYARSLHDADNEISRMLPLHRWASASNTYIYIEKMGRAVKCGQPVQFVVHYTSDKFRPNENVTFHYLIKSRNEIVDVGRFTHTPKRQSLNLAELKNVLGAVNRFTWTESRVDKFILKLKLGGGVISKSQLVVYFALNREIIAANADILVEKCLRNKVNVRWAEPQLYPGELADLNIETGPGSLCAISSVDKASTFLTTGKPLNIHQVLSPFLQERSPKPSYKPNCLAFHRRRPENYTEDKFWDLRRRKRYYGMLGSDDFDAFEVFTSTGVGVITNLRLLSKQCVQRDIVLRGGVPFGLSYDEQYENGGVSIRTFFPETWLWELVPVGETGQTNMARYLPHSITTWLTNAVCVSPVDGVGVAAAAANLNVFKPFFLDVLLPYSIKRGEVLHMNVVVFNYMNHSLPIRVTLGDAKNLALADASDARSVTFCISGGDSSTHVYRVKGVGLGTLNVSVLAEIESSYPGECGPEVIVNRRDVMYKSVLVEAEGYPSEMVRSSFLCANDTMSNNNITWNLVLPKNVVPDSAAGRVLLNADLLGPTIQNLENLLTVPTGCGEQIMATMAPNLYVLRYLKAVDQLTPAVYQRALRNLKIGYQRILDYVHQDGSFSAFGYHDPSGSMFLTAFVVRTLRQARKYIYVDDKVTNKAVTWITDNQLENGCFAAVSHVFQDMGGTSNENSTAALTSYVLISLLESNVPLTETVRTNAKYCIRGHYQADKYTLAISSYALYLVDWYTEADRCLQRLLEAATRENNLMWWTHQGISSSTSIEMTSYVLMSLLHRNTTDNTIHASAIVRWLATQRGPQGGFSTSQDTAVALDATSRFANLMRNKQPELNVTVSTYKQNSYLQIKRDDWLKTKQQKLNDIPTKVKVTVSGQGCALVQAVVSYSLKNLNGSEAFKLAIDVEPMSTIDRCSMAMISPCISYMGPGTQSNMAVMEVTMPSGYEPDRASLYQLTSEDDTKVKRFEELKNRVVLYFTQLSNEPVCIRFSINENVFVENLINTTITLYDYYKPELSITKSYKINTCQSNEIAPVPPLPVEENKTNSPPTDDAAATPEPERSSRRATGDFRKRSAEYNVLNGDFVNVDFELATPDGMEGNAPVYVTPDPAHRRPADD